MRHSERPSLVFHMSGPNGRTFHANVKLVGVVDSRSAQGHSRRDPLLHLEAPFSFAFSIISLLHLHGVGSRLGIWPRVTSVCVPAGSSGCLLWIPASTVAKKSIQSVRHRCFCRFEHGLVSASEHMTPESQRVSHLMAPSY